MLVFYRGVCQEQTGQWGFLEIDTNSVVMLAPSKSSMRPSVGFGNPSRMFAAHCASSEEIAETIGAKLGIGSVAVGDKSP
jgi:hypothetical protein